MSSRNSLGISSAVRAAVIARDLSSCQWCGAHVRTSAGWYSIQHRRARGMGGSRSQATNRPANLLLVCGTGTTECHGWIEAHPAEALARGFRISSSARPALVPYTDSTGREWILNDDGTKTAGAPATLEPPAYSEPPLVYSLPEAGRAVLEALNRSQA